MRKILLPAAISHPYCEWLREEGINNFQVFDGMADDVVPRKSIAGQQIADYVFKNSDRQDFLVLFNMPSVRVSKMNGIELANLLHSNSPNVPIAIISNMLDESSMPPNVLEVSYRHERKSEFISFVNKVLQLADDYSRQKELETITAQAEKELEVDKEEELQPSLTRIKRKGKKKKFWAKFWVGEPTTV